MLVNEINFKLVIIGHGGVGKTSIVNYFLGSKPPESYMPTIGYTINRKEYIIDDISIRVSIWDVGGQRSFNPTNIACFTNVDAAFLIFDLANPKDTIKEFQYYLNNLTERTEECVLITMGNKLDLITKESFQGIVEEHSKLNLPLVIGSATTGENIEEAFELIILTFLKEWEKKFPSSNINNIAKKFLNHIKKKEGELKQILINPATINEIIIKREKEPPLIRKVVKSTSVDYRGEFSEKSLILQKKIKQIDKAEDDIVSTFQNNLLEVKNMILALKFTPIDQLIEKVDKTAGQLSLLSSEFEYSFRELLKLKEEKDTKKEENSMEGQ